MHFVEPEDMSLNFHKMPMDLSLRRCRSCLYTSNVKSSLCVSRSQIPGEEE